MPRDMNDFSALDMAVLGARANYLQNRAAAKPAPIAAPAAPAAIAPQPTPTVKEPSVLRQRVQNNVKGLIGNWWKRLSGQFGG